MSLKKDILRWLSSNEGLGRIESRRCARYPRGYVRTDDIRGYPLRRNNTRQELRNMGFVQYEVEVLVPSSGLSMTDIMRDWVTCDYARNIVNRTGALTISNIIGVFNSRSTVAYEIELALITLGWTKTDKGYVP